MRLKHDYSLPCRSMFFIGGYFTPSSVKRKGSRVFMKDKLKRLGLPFLAYTFVLGPGLVAFMLASILDRAHILLAGL